MDYDAIDVEPAPSRFFDEGTRAGATPLPATGAPAGETDVAYLERAARYEREYDEALRRLPRLGPPAQRFPSLRAALPGRTVTVIFDTVLDRRLLEIYVLHGWEGIRRVQAAFDRLANDRYRRDLYPWPVVRSFLDYARNRLLLQIRTALVDVERLAAADLVAQLESTVGLAAETWSALALRESAVDAAGRPGRVPSRTPSPSWDTPAYEAKTFYLIGNAALGERLLAAVGQAVKALRTLGELQASLDTLSERLEAFRDEVGSGPPSGMVVDQEKLTAQVAVQAELLETRYREVQAICPLAVLAVPLLSPPVALADLGQALGEALRHLVGEAEKLAKPLGREESWVAALAPLGEAPLETLFPADLCLEEAAVAAAIDRVGADPAYLSLLREETLIRLVDVGRVEKDDLRYVVLSHTVTALLAALASEQERAARVAAAAGVLAKGAALLSLVLWVTPAGPVARGVSAVLGMGLAAYQTYSVVHQLSLLDRKLAERLAGLDARRAEEVVALSEVARLRPEYLAALTATVATEVLLIAAAGALPQLKQVLHVRGYYLDLETLVGS